MNETINKDAVDVEQIMRQIRARVREKHGAAYTEAELQQLAGARLDTVLDPAGTRPKLVAEFRRRATAGSVTDYPVEPNSYDVVLFLGVLNKKTSTGYVGTKELERLLRATRRQIIIRANIQSYEKQITRLIDILEKMDEQGFDAICFSRRLGQGNMIIGNRRGTDAKLGTVPPLVLVPTEHLREHPCLRGARIGTIKDFA